jgi:hypothetical protein
MPCHLPSQFLSILCEWDSIRLVYSFSLFLLSPLCESSVLDQHNIAVYTNPFFSYFWHIFTIFHISLSTNFYFQPAIRKIPPRKHWGLLSNEILSVTHRIEIVGKRESFDIRVPAVDACGAGELEWGLWSLIFDSYQLQVGRKRRKICTKSQSCKFMSVLCVYKS